jgi:glycosyltransferase involved in cell wall biosynthesis
MNGFERREVNTQLPITALILTFNEEANIERTLRSVDWIPNILIIDSGSTDKTLLLLSQYSSVHIIHRPFDTFAHQCNYGLDHIKTPWVLSLDADYRLSSELIQEISHLFTQNIDPTLAGFKIPFRYCIGGRPVRGTLLPPRTCLYRTELGRYRDDGHGHRVVIRGRTTLLSSPIYHDDRKPISRWLRSQHEYMIIEASNLRSTSYHDLSWPDRLRRETPLAPLAIFFLCLVWKGGILDGWRGWFYALQRMYAELLLLILLMDARIAASSDNKVMRSN